MTVLPHTRTGVVTVALGLILAIFSSRLGLYGQNHEGSIVPVSEMFHNIGQNVLNSFACNYGMNFVGAGLGTWLFIETGLDWKWRNVAYNNAWLPDLGIPGLYIGYIVPGLTPIVVYAAGRIIKDKKLQIAGLALAQSLTITLAIQSSLKMITGRSLPGIVDELDHTRISRPDDFSGEFNWFNLNFIAGWPSGHTANAFAAAAVLAELYRESPLVTIAVYSYAALIGFGLTLNVHWASESLAGALIGYAVGKTVGQDFKGLLNGEKQKSNISLYGTSNSIGIRIWI
jgi:membrane-associated phospholipid phosphatase